MKAVAIMPQDELSARDRAVLIALLSQARKVSNPELKKLIGFPLDGEARRRLNDAKLVESGKQGRAYVHELSDYGWRWCAEHLASGGHPRETSLERAHRIFFGVLARYMSAAGLSLADVVTLSLPTGPSGRHERSAEQDLPTRVEDAYLALASRGQALVKLRELRGRLADVPRADLDATLTELYAARRVNLIPQSSQQALTAADREAAVRVGGEYKHLISIG
jgi:hypothetical protein